MRQRIDQIKLSRILDLLESTNTVIVSYGLAPNPTGFCYERGEDLSPDLELELNELLDSLTGYEESCLKVAVGL